MNGKLTKTSNDYNSYEISDADQNYIFVLADILTKRFDFHMVNAPVVGLDSVYWEATKKNVKLTVGWDIWSGAFVMAHCSEGSEYVERLESCLNENLYCKMFIDFDNEPGKAKKALARCYSQDDVLFLLDDNSYAIVHLTYSKNNIGGCPSHIVFPDLHSAIGNIEEEYLAEYVNGQE